MHNHIKYEHWLHPETGEDITAVMKPKTYCFICQQKFGFDLKRHQRKVHGGAETIEIPDSTENHSEAPADGDSRNCTLCSSKFTGSMKKANLRNHMRYIHWRNPDMTDVSDIMKPKTYCTICDRNYGSGFKKKFSGFGQIITKNR